jgi:stearoyl-CoA desaturase (delta-9 desaturase)
MDRPAERATDGRRRWPLLSAVVSWFDSWSELHSRGVPPKGVHWARVAPFVFLHLGCLGVVWVGWSPVAVAVAVGFYLLRAFFVTGFYHRYFSHRSFKTSRAAQLVFAVLGNSAVQRGPLWWASHHRRHHRDTDREGDPHSPRLRGFLWSHIGWLTDQENYRTDLSLVPDLVRYRELRWLDRFDTVVPLVVMAAMYGLGELLALTAPGLGTNGPQMLVWGFFVSTVILFHVTCLVNSAAHMFGKRPFATRDTSRNSLIIALLTLGEGWHNNHHRYPASTRQGFLPREIDVTYYVLLFLARCGLIWDVKPVPAHILEQRGRGAQAGTPA